MSFCSLWQRNIENGVRTSKLTAYSSYKYILNDSQIAAEMWDDCINIYLYDEYGSPIDFLHRYKNMAEDTYKTYFYEKNMFGDILAVYDQNGVKQVSYSYDAFGKSTRTIHVANTRADNNNLRYRGYYYDFETGFYYLNSRYYDPVTCRFINADGYVSTGQGLIGYNMFAYCGNNPVMYVDPTGESATVLAWKIAEVVIFVVLVCVVVKTLVENPPKLPEISLPQWKPKTETEEKDVEDELEAIANQFDIYECKEAAEAMKNHHKNGNIIELYFENAYNGYVICDKYPNEAISLNGKHAGYLYNGIVWCNIYPEGLPKDEWIARFHSASGQPPQIIIH